MRLKDYGRNRKERKEYIHQSGLLITGMDVSKAKYDACIGTLEGVRSNGFREPIHMQDSGTKLQMVIYR